MRTVYPWLRLHYPAALSPHLDLSTAKVDLLALHTRTPLQIAITVMDLQAGENVIPIDIVGDLIPQEYIKQLVTQKHEN